jgi:hypothetical protein
MNSRIVPIVTALVAVAIAIFFIAYFEGAWRWLIASPLIVFVVWPSIKIGLFASQQEVDKLTGADKLSASFGLSADANSDRIWGKLNSEQLEALQNGFMQVCLKEKLEQYVSTSDLPLTALETVSEVANKVSKQFGISPAFVPLVVHQYVDADHMLRVLHRERWASYMASRPDLAPQPESYFDYIDKVYFSGKHSTGERT